MALYAFLSPMVLARALDTNTYSAYVLGLQVVPFLLLLATPVQATLGPKFARYRAEIDGGASRVATLVSLAARYFLTIALLAMAVSLALSYLMPELLAWGGSFASDSSQAIRYLGLAAALTMPAFVFTSYAAGNQNYLWDNFLKCLGPYLGLVVVFAVWQFTSSSRGTLPMLWVIGISSACTVFAAMVVLCVGLLQPFASKISWLQTPSHSVGVLWKEAGGTYWWQLCALLSVATGPFMVSRVDSGSVAAYAIAVSTMTVTTGISTAFSGPFSIQIAQSVAHLAAQRAKTFRRFHDRFMLFIYVSTFVLLAMPQVIFEWWLGEFLGRVVSQLLVPLALANFLRQVTAPYTAAILGLGQQEKIWLSPLVEAVLSILFGLLLGNVYGAQGVAYGLLAAALVRLLVTLFYDLRITRKALPLFARHLLFPSVLSLFGPVKK